MTKSAGNCGFGQIYWRNPQWKTSFLCSAIITFTWKFWSLLWKNWSSLITCYLHLYLTIYNPSCSINTIFSVKVQRSVNTIFSAKVQMGRHLYIQERVKKSRKVIHMKFQGSVIAFLQMKINNCSHKSSHGSESNTAQKWKFSIKDFFSKCDQMVRFTEEILNGKLYSLYSAVW